MSEDRKFSHNDLIKLYQADVEAVADLGVAELSDPNKILLKALSFDAANESSLHVVTEMGVAEAPAYEIVGVNDPELDYLVGMHCTLIAIAGDPIKEGKSRYMTIHRDDLTIWWNPAFLAHELESGHAATVLSDDARKKLGLDVPADYQPPGMDRMNAVLSGQAGHLTDDD